MGLLKDSVKADKFYTKSFHHYLYTFFKIKKNKLHPPCLYGNVLYNHVDSDLITKNPLWE